MIGIMIPVLENILKKYIKLINGSSINKAIRKTKRKPTRKKFNYTKFDKFWHKYNNKCLSRTNNFLFDKKTTIIIDNKIVQINNKYK